MGFWGFGVLGLGFLGFTGFRVQGLGLIGAVVIRTGFRGMVYYHSEEESLKKNIGN